jgi:hypothetical protein
MNDERRDVHGRGVGSENGEGPGGFIDAEAPEGNSQEGGRGSVGQIYFVETEDGRFVKIGYSTKVIRRLGQLGTLMPVRLIGCFPGSVDTERRLHEKFASHRKTGEWFNNAPQIKEFMTTVELIQPGVKRKKANLTSEAAVALAKLRWKKLSAKERSEIARKAGAASKANLTPEQRSAIARKAGLAGGRGRGKK